VAWSRRRRPSGLAARLWADSRGVAPLTAKGSAARRAAVVGCGLMLRAGSHGSAVPGRWGRGGAALACGVALMCGACAAPMHAPSSPAQEPQRERLEDAQRPAAEAPVSPEQQSELDALDLDLREAERHLERQLQAKQDEARLAERRALEKDEGKRD